MEAVHVSGRDGGCAAQVADNDSEDLSDTVDAPPASAHASAALAAARVVEPHGSAAPEAEAAATPAKKLRRRWKQTEDTLRTGSSERHAEPTAPVRFVLDAAAVQASAPRLLWRTWSQRTWTSPRWKIGGVGLRELGTTGSSSTSAVSGARNCCPRTRFGPRSLVRLQARPALRPSVWRAEERAETRRPRQMGAAVWGAGARC